MAEDAPQPGGEPAGAGQPGTPPAWDPGSGGTSGGLEALLDERPEIAVGGAFAGGMLLALLLKKLSS